MTAHHQKVKLAKKLKDLKDALKEYTDFCAETIEWNKARDMQDKRTGKKKGKTRV